MAIDQLLWNPIFGLMFFSYLGLAEGKSFNDIQAKIKNDLMTAVVGSWTVWIPGASRCWLWWCPCLRGNAGGMGMWQTKSY